MNLAEEIIKGNHRAVAKAISLVENDSKKSPEIIKKIFPYTGKSTVIGVTGTPGSGKSTLTKLLQGFYMPNDGQIQIDGHDIRNFSANELRQYFGVVPQEAILFSGTIFENLILANPHASFAQVVQACKQAEIHDVIEALPEGYQTKIGERGTGLSGGQKQRLAIARALLKHPKILLFDEATSSLDAGTAEVFAATVNQLKGKITMLFITHQIPAALKVDTVIQIGDVLVDKKEVSGQETVFTPAAG